MVQALGVQEAWGATGDEIGSLFHGAPEKKEHMGCCPHCRRAFREFIEADGRSLRDFGAASWEDVRPCYGYWAKNFWVSLEELRAAVARAEKEQKALLDKKAERTADLQAGQNAEDDEIDREVLKTKGESAEEVTERLTALRERLHALEWDSRILYTPEDQRELRVSEKGWNLIQYYSRLFNGRMTAVPSGYIMEAFARQNAHKREALAGDDTTSKVATQPWICSYALRQPAFTWGGHSLGFFEFYRHSGNAMCYETSNRDYRVWHWESYLNDVGRSIGRFLGKPSGVYIKPHRGAPAQRALSAAARDCRMIYLVHLRTRVAHGRLFRRQQGAPAYGGMGQPHARKGRGPHFRGGMGLPSGSGRGAPAYGRVPWFGVRLADREIRQHARG